MIIDAAVHPLISTDDYLELLESPWRDQARLTAPLPLPFGKLFEAPFEDVADPEAAGDPDRIAEFVFGERGPAGTLVDAAVLTPLTRGLVPNPHHLAAIARATNTWLRNRFLENAAPGREWFGSIRVPITDPFAAVREIEFWAGEPRFVQIAVPLRVWSQYGDERYFPIWEAAAAHGMPVYVQDDLASVAEYPHSSVGQPVHFAENDALRSALSIVHLLSITTSGMVDRLPGLKFIFGDGGLDVAMPLLWRADNDWRSGRVEVPWVTELPSVAAGRIGRFISQAQDGTPDGERLDLELTAITHAGSQMIFGSHHPYWDEVDPARVTDGFAPADRDRVLAENVLEVTPRLAAALGPAAVSAAGAASAESPASNG